MIFKYPVVYDEKVAKIPGESPQDRRKRQFSFNYSVLKGIFYAYNMWKTQSLNSAKEDATLEWILFFWLPDTDFCDIILKQCYSKVEERLPPVCLHDFLARDLSMKDTASIVFQGLRAFAEYIRHIEIDDYMKDFVGVISMESITALVRDFEKMFTLGVSDEALSEAIVKASTGTIRPIGT